MDELINKLKVCFDRPLPGIRAHQAYAPIDREINPSLFDSDDYRHSAVAVICTIHNNQPCLVLTKRTPYEGVHGGQISFPGGKKEENDPTGEYAARRETWEEIGIHIYESELIGKLTDVYIPVSKFRVEPYFYLKDEVSNYLLNAREVSEVIHLPVDFLLSETCNKLVTISVASQHRLKNVPAFIYDNHIIWGATALMLGEIRTMLLEVLEPKPHTSKSGRNAI